MEPGNIVKILQSLMHNLCNFYLEGCDVIPLKGRHGDLGHRAANGGRRAYTKKPEARAEVRVGGEG